MLDRDGLEITGPEAARAAWDAAVGAAHALRPEVAGHLERLVELDPAHVGGRALRAMLARPFALPLQPVAELLAARPDAGTPRERSLLRAARPFAAVGPAAAAGLLLEHLRAFPPDTAVMVPTFTAVLASGDVTLHRELRRLTRLQHAERPTWRSAGAEAYWLQEEGRFGEAAALAQGALAETPDAGLAAHSLTHCYYETGAHREGKRWLDTWRSGRDVVLYGSHFPWHSALHALAENDVSEVLRLLAEDIADSAVPDVGSLRWRLCLAGRPAPERPEASALADGAAALRLSPALSWWAALGAAADGDVDRLRAQAQAAATWELPCRALLVRVLRGLACAAAEQWSDAADALDGLDAHAVAALGGSHAQREAIEDTRLVALLRAGRPEPARALLEERLARRPHAVDTRWQDELPVTPR